MEERLVCLHNSHGFMTKLAQQQHHVWEGLHVSPRACPSSVGSRTMTCPCPSLGFERSCSSEWDPMACPLSKADLSGLASPATFAGARYAVLCLLVMSVTISLSALSFTWLGHSPHLCFMTLRVPCGVWSGTRIKRLSASFWRPYFIGLRH